MLRRPLTRVRCNICLLMGALLLLSWGSFVFSFTQDYRTIQKHYGNNIKTMAAGLEAHVRQVVQVNDLLLLDIARHFYKYPASELRAIFSDWFERSPELVGLAVIDVQSAQILFALNDHPLFESFTEQPFWTSADADSVRIADNLYVGRDGQGLIALFRQYRQGDRPLVVVSLLRADFLFGVHPEIDLGPNGAASIFHRNGLLLARNPHAKQLVGQSFAEGPLFSEALRDSGEGLRSVPAATAESTRLVAHRQLADLPLIITVGTSDDWMFADWWGRLFNFLIIQLAVTIAVIVSLVLLVKTILRVERAEVKLEEREEHFRSVANSSVDAIISVDLAERIRFWSVGAEKIFACPAAEALDMPISCFLAFSAGEEPLTLERLVGDDQLWSPQRTLEVQGQRQQGEVFPTELSISQGTVVGKRLYTLIVRDVSERKQMEERIKRMASHDNLTCLPNRGLLMDRLQVAMAQVRRQGGQFALLFVDLDRFKPVNDTYGHDAGDKLLKQVAERMLVTVRASDTVARVGGDEFAILLSNVEDEEAVCGACDNLLSSLRQKFRVKGKLLSISCSIGVVLYRGQEQSAIELIGRADVAMYAAKRAGKNRYAVADNEVLKSS